VCHNESLSGNHARPQVRKRFRLDRLAAGAAERQPLERAWDDLIQPGQRLLPGYLAGRSALGDRAGDRTAKEHDDPVRYWGDYSERDGVG